MSITSIGIDLSLVGTGVVLLIDGKVVAKELIKSKPVGDKPINELNRIRKIVGDIRDKLPFENVDIAVIEGLAFMAKGNSLVQLSALNYMTRAMLADRNIPFVIVAPTSLKKFVTGSGNAKKDEMLLATFKRWGVSILDDNVCDAYGLAQMGLAILGGNSKATNKVQEQDLEKFKKQL